MKKRINDFDYYGRYMLFENLDKFSWQRFDRDEEVEILCDERIEDDNIWNADRLFVAFRTKEGFLGYYELIPSGYSSYTYDPDEHINVYKTDDLQWFKRYAIPPEMRKYL